MSVWALALGLGIANTEDPRQTFFGKDGGEYFRGRIVLLLDPKSRAATVVGSAPGIRITNLSANRKFAVAEVEPNGDIFQVCRKLKSIPGVMSAHPDAVMHASRVPNDSLFAQQWSLPKCRFTNFWDYYRGSSSIVVAVLDSGIGANIPDLIGHLLPGKDYAHNKSGLLDVYGHGTPVAGVVGAAADNTKGIAGAGWNVMVKPMKVSDDQGHYSESAAAFALQDCIADPQVRAVNMSFGGVIDDSFFEAAIADAAAAGIVLVASAGNDNTSDPRYPAAYDGVLSVGGTDLTDSRAVFSDLSASNYGDWVRVAAPSDIILTTVNTGDYAYFQGTSFGSPQVAGLGALLSAQFGPRNSMTPKFVRAYIEKSSETIGDWLHFGRIDAWQAFQQARYFAPLSTDTVPSSQLRSGSTIASLIVDSDGSTCVAGSIGQGSDLKMVASRFTPLGVNSWTTPLSLAGLGDTCSQMKKLHNGGYVLVGSSNVSGGTTNATLFRLSSGGLHTGSWTISVPGSGATTVCVDANDSCYVGGATFGKPWVSKIDSSNTVVWAKTLVNDTKSQVSKVVLDEKSGYLYAVGTCFGRRSWYVSRINAQTGALIFTKYLASKYVGASLNDCVMTGGWLYLAGSLGDSIGLEATILKVNPLTGLVANGAWKGGSIPLPDEYLALSLTPSGQIVATGSIRNQIEGQVAVTSLYNSTYLDEVSSRTYSAFGDVNTGQIDSFGSDVAVAPNGRIFVAATGLSGNRGYNAARLMYDSVLGPSLCQRWWDGFGNNDSAKKVGVDAGGNAYFACLSQRPDGNREIVVLKDKP